MGTWITCTCSTAVKWLNPTRGWQSSSPVPSSNDAKIKLLRSDTGLLGIFPVAIGGAVNRKRNFHVLRLEYSYEKFLL